MGKFFSIVGPIVGLAFVGLAASPHVIDDGVDRATLLALAGDIHNCAGGLYQRTDPGGRGVSRFSLARAAQAVIERALCRPPPRKRGARRAGVAELVDAPDLDSGDQNRGGSSPSARTIAARCERFASASAKRGLFGRAAEGVGR